MIESESTKEIKKWVNIKSKICMRLKKLNVPEHRMKGG